MAGCRSLLDSEIELVLNNLYTSRDKLLFILGLKTGFRITELLSLKVSDVWAGGAPVSRLRVGKRNTKGKVRNREVILHKDARAAIAKYLGENETLSSDSPVFLSRNGINETISRHGAHKVLKQAYRAAGLTGALATHSMRKTFAGKVYLALDKDLLATRDALNHQSVSSTERYLETNRQAIDAAILAS